MRWRVGWWDALVVCHRWLGIAGGLLFILWFSSGVAMMYVRMPELTPEERFARLPPLDPSAIAVSPADAAKLAGAPLTTPFRLTMLGGRPVYCFGEAAATTVFADRAEKFENVSRADALALAREFAPQSAATLRYAGLLSIPDQWTLQSRAYFPLHHIELGDSADSEVYVSAKTGELVMQSSRRERLFAYVGPVAHWLYLPALRRNGPLWTRVIIWASVAGCALCLSGLTVGLFRFSPRRRYVIHDARTVTPYAGWLKWHHYAGLIFGVVTFTWIFSGLLSMGPFVLLSSEGVTTDQRRALAGTPLRLDTIGTEAVKSAILSARSELNPKELSLIQFNGRAYWIASATPTRHVLVEATGRDSRPIRRFGERELQDVARKAVPGAPIVESTWLTSYDAYYYDRRGVLALPVLRVQYDDPRRTWITWILAAARSHSSYGGPIV